MILSQYGLRLRRLRQEDLEQVRLWRNAPHVQKSMQFQQHITAEMQEQWFASIQNVHNMYFLIIAEEKPLGLVNVKNIDWGHRLGEAGIFIGEESFLGTTLSVRATLVMMDMMFDVFGLEKLRAKIHTENISAIYFNLALGYMPLYSIDPCFTYYEVSKETYQKNTRHLRYSLQKIYGADAEPVFLEAIDALYVPYINNNP